MINPLNGHSANQLVEKYIGTAYDTVKRMVANLPLVERLLAKLGQPSGMHPPVYEVAATPLVLEGAANITGGVIGHGERILVTAQSDSTQNGIYVVNVSGPWERAEDFKTTSDVLSGQLVNNRARGDINNTSTWMVHLDTPQFIEGVSKVMFSKAISRTAYGDVDVELLNVSNGVRHIVGYSTLAELRNITEYLNHPISLTTSNSFSVYRWESGNTQSDDGDQIIEVVGDSSGRLVKQDINVTSPEIAAAIDGFIELITLPTGTVAINGGTYDSIGQRIDNHFDAMSALLQGKLPFETASLLASSGAPTPDAQGNFPLAEVWNDSVANNGIYGWDGTQWLKSAEDSYSYNGHLTEPVTIDIENDITKVYSGTLLTYDHGRYLSIPAGDYSLNIPDSNILWHLYWDTSSSSLAVAVAPSTIGKDNIHILSYYLKKPVFGFSNTTFTEVSVSSLGYSLGKATPALELESNIVTTSNVPSLLLTEKGNYISLPVGTFTITPPSTNVLWHLYWDTSVNLFSTIAAPNAIPSEGVHIASYYQSKLVLGQENINDKSYELYPLQLTAPIEVDVTTDTITVPTGILGVHTNGAYFSIPSGVHSLVMPSSNTLWHLYFNKDTNEFGQTTAPDVVPDGLDIIATYYYKAPIRGQSNIAYEDAQTVPQSNVLGSTLIATVPQTLYLKEGRGLNLYKRGLTTANSSELPFIDLLLDTGKLAPNNVIDLSRSVTQITSTELNGTSKAYLAHASQPDKRVTQEIVVQATTGDNVPSAINWLCIGDSLTEVHTPLAIKTKLENELAVTINHVGTYAGGSSDGIHSEGRGYWSYRTFIGKSNLSGAPHYIATGAITGKWGNPFLRLATTTDKATNPEWCFRNTASLNELSYEDDTDKSGDFYIFDFGHYLNHTGITPPDVVTIALSTNDINLSRNVFNESDRLSYCSTGLTLMIHKIKTALPNVRIGVVPAPGYSFTENSIERRLEKANWIFRAQRIVNDLSTTYSGISVIPNWCTMTGIGNYDFSSSSPINTDSSSILNNITDWVHYNEEGRDEYAEGILHWLVNQY